MEQQTKKCPYCGEEILAVARKCKHCGEWLDRKEQKPCPVCGELIDEDAKVCPHCNETVNKTAIDHSLQHNREMLYCKTCKAKLNKGTDSCPQCGDKDPFLFGSFNSINKLGKLLLWYIIFVILIGLPIVLLEFSTPYAVGTIVFWIILWFALLVFFQKTAKVLQKNDADTMKSVTKEVGDENAFNEWNKDINSRKGLAATLFNLYV